MEKNPHFNITFRNKILGIYAPSRSHQSNVTICTAKLSMCPFFLTRPDMIRQIPDPTHRSTRSTDNSDLHRDARDVLTAITNIISPVTSTFSLHRTQQPTHRMTVNQRHINPTLHYRPKFSRIKFHLTASGIFWGPMLSSY